MKHINLKKELVSIAGKIPCDMCEAKGGENIESDGSCRHKPTDEYEVLGRIKKAVDKYFK